jgi:hypothetical protein
MKKKSSYRFIPINVYFPPASLKSVSTRTMGTQTEEEQVTPAPEKKHDEATLTPSSPLPFIYTPPPTPPSSPPLLSMLWKNEFEILYRDEMDHQFHVQIYPLWETFDLIDPDNIQRAIQTDGFIALSIPLGRKFSKPKTRITTLQQLLRGLAFIYQNPRFCLWVDNETKEISLDSTDKDIVPTSSTTTIDIYRLERVE